MLTTLFGLGTGVWSRNMDTAYRAVRAVQTGRVWTNTYHQYPAPAAGAGAVMALFHCASKWMDTILAVKTC